MGELVGGMHSQSFGTQRNAITITTALGMAMEIEWDGGDPSTAGGYPLYFRYNGLESLPLVHLL